MGRRLISVFLLLCAIAVGLLPRAHTFAQETHTASWSRYDVTIELERSGALLITERFDVAFSGLPAFTYGFADILTDRIDQLEVVSVSEDRPEGRQEFRQVSTGDFNRTPGTFVVKVDADSTYIEYAFSPALNEARVFELTYRAYGALRVYGHGEGRDEQIWW
ncbi:MAG: hypothetical protein IT336_14865, partial [Thermomicrobiales bacterium]|nr:hypothetical protein [Thermomicrobiales bacterium]